MSNLLSVSLLASSFIRSSSVLSARDRCLIQFDAPLQKGTRKKGYAFTRPPPRSKHSRTRHSSDGFSERYCKQDQQTRTKKKMN